MQGSERKHRGTQKRLKGGWEGREARSEDRKEAK